MNDCMPDFCGTCQHVRVDEELTPLHGVRTIRRCALVLPPWMLAPNEESRIVDEYDSCSFWSPGSISDDEA